MSPPTQLSETRLWNRSARRHVDKWTPENVISLTKVLSPVLTLSLFLLWAMYILRGPEMSSAVLTSGLVKAGFNSLQKAWRPQP